MWPADLKGTRWTATNDPEGMAATVARRRARIVTEATGGYERALVAALVAAGLPLVVAKPRQVRDVAKATGQLAKTDRLDADHLALFAERVRPTPRPLPDPVLQQLDAPPPVGRHVDGGAYYSSLRRRLCGGA